MTTIYSIGHSNHPLEMFLSFLGAHAIERLIDVRRFPASRRWPHFNRAALEASLPDHHIAYEWIEDLGGRRSAASKDSPHTAWTVDAFRHYADYMDTEAFRSALNQLIARANEARCAFMCAEARYWQCHRSEERR